MNYLLWEEPNTLPQVESRLARGDILLTSTDTVLGLLADLSPRSVIALNKIKKRAGKPYLVLVSGTEKAGRFVSFNEKSSFQIEKLMNICWPGPVTLLCQARGDIPSYIKSPEGTVALRVPDHPQLLRLLQKFEGLFSTSANSSGAHIPKTIDEVEKVIVEAVDGIVIEKNEKKETVPSTILDCTGDRIKVIRQGAFSIEKIEKLLGQKLEV